MAVFYISEFQQGISSIGTTEAQIRPQPSLVDQIVAIGGASVQSSAFNAATRCVRITADATCSFVFGPQATATATTTNARLAAGQTEFFAVQPGHVVAVITNT